MEKNLYDQHLFRLKLEKQKNQKKITIIQQNCPGFSIIGWYLNKSSGALEKRSNTRLSSA